MLFLHPCLRLLVHNCADDFFLQIDECCSSHSPKTLHRTLAVERLEPVRNIIDIRQTRRCANIPNIGAKIGGAGDNLLERCPTLLVADQMHFVDANEPYLLSDLRPSAPIACHRVPFFWCGHSQLIRSNVVQCAHVPGIRLARYQRSLDAVR